MLRIRQRVNLCEEPRLKTLYKYRKPLLVNRGVHPRSHERRESNDEARAMVPICCAR